MRNNISNYSNNIINNNNNKILIIIIIWLLTIIIDDKISLIKRMYNRVTWSGTCKRVLFDLSFFTSILKVTKLQSVLLKMRQGEKMRLVINLRGSFWKCLIFFFTNICQKVIILNPKKWNKLSKWIQFQSEFIFLGL